MKIYVYSFYDPESGKLLHKGTAKELTEAGVFCHPTRLSNVWAKYQRHLAKGAPSEWRIERKLVEVEMKRSTAAHPAPHHKGRRGEGKATKAERIAKAASSRFEQIKDPSPLQWDVHILCLYNEEAQQLGKQNLSYGEWSSFGKPEHP